jgi:hypothetical protein
MDPIVANVQLTAEDYVQAHRLHRQRSSWAGRHASALIVLLALVCGVVLVFLLRDIWALHLTLVILAAGFLVDRFWVAARARRSFRADPNLQSGHTLEFSDFGVQTSARVTPSSHRWSEIPRWAEGELHYLIYAPDGTYHLVPKRSMSDTMVLGEVLRDRVGPAA